MLGDLTVLHLRMANSVQISLRLKSNELRLAIEALRVRTGKMPDKMANQACGAIAYKAWMNMPKVDPDNIVKELEVQRVGVTAKGNLSKAKKPRKFNIIGNPSPFAETGKIPWRWGFSSLAQLVVLSSFYPNSNFNRKTGGVWQREKPNTKGSAEFFAWMQSTVGRMVSSRRSSTGFFKACARAINIGFGMALGKVRRVPGDDVNKTSKLLAKGLAEVYPAKNNSGRARFTVAATEPDTKGNQGALERVAGRVWQRAVDSEAEFIRLQVIEEYKKEIRQAGFVVK